MARPFQTRVAQFDYHRQKSIAEKLRAGRSREKLPPSQERFKDNGDGTITDNYLKLMWQKATNGRTSYTPVWEMLPNFEPASHRDWRLPTVDELRFIVDYRKKIPQPSMCSLRFLLDD